VTILIPTSLFVLFTIEIFDNFSFPFGPSLKGMDYRVDLSWMMAKLHTLKCTASFGDSRREPGCSLTLEDINLAVRGGSKLDYLYSGIYLEIFI
jgi:hypothetical protein